jgi:single-strand DNA-binding protein
MSYDLNRWVGIGRLTKDIEIKYLADGKAVGKMSIAVGGMKKDQVSFFNVVVWGKTAENAANFLSKGKQCAIDGRLEQRSWKAQDGTNRSVVEIIADRLEFLGGKPAEGARSSGGQPAQKPEPEATYEDNFYDSTDFNSNPVNPDFNGEVDPNLGPNF